MKDENKTKEQLIKELGEMRQRIKKLELLEVESNRIGKDLRNCEEKFSKVFMASPSAYLISNVSDETFFDCNKTFLEMTEFTMDELAGKSLLELNTWENLKDHENFISMIKKSGKVDCLETAFISKSGKRISAIISSRLIELKGETFVISMIRNITEWKKAENERLKLEKKIHETQRLESLGLLAGGIAHDFNNLLTSVLGNADLALLELSKESPVLFRIKDIKTAAIRLSELTKQMLAYSGKGKFVIEPINLSKLVEEMSHLLEVSITKNVVIKYDLIGALPPINGDASQIRQIIMNLITNASEAIGSKSGFIALSTGIIDVDRKYLLDISFDKNIPEGYYVFIEVSDTGCGMDQETIDKIFDPFYTTKFTGRGLGLAAVLGIVRGHAGAIKVYSEPRRGTTFKLIFPRSEYAEPLSAESQEDIELWHGSGTILIVDDEETVRAVAKMIMEKVGLIVLTAEDGREAIKILNEHTEEISIVLLDLTMPHKNGIETFGEIRRINIDLPVILTSGYNEQEATSHFSGKGLADFIQKPFKVKDLVDKIRKALKESQS